MRGGECSVCVYDWEHEACTHMEWIAGVCSPLTLKVKVCDVFGPIWVYECVTDVLGSLSSQPIVCIHIAVRRVGVVSSLSSTPHNTQ